LRLATHMGIEADALLVVVCHERTAIGFSATVIGCIPSGQNHITPIQVN
jgi:hypothetical protein